MRANPGRYIIGSATRWSSPASTTTEILGVPIPEIIIPVSVGRDLVNLVEIAAQQFKLRTAGYDPVAALDEQLKRRALS